MPPYVSDSYIAMLNFVHTDHTALAYRSIAIKSPSPLPNHLPTPLIFITVLPPYPLKHTHPGCGSDSTILPLNKTLSWLPTLRGDSLDVRCPVSSPDVAVTRTCSSEDREWMDPLRIQDCYNATIDEAFTEISKMLNQVRLFVRVLIIIMKGREP